MTTSPIIKLQELKVTCGACSLSHLCLPHGLEPEEVDLLDQMIEHKFKLERGDALFRIGNAHRAIYAVRSGSFKTFLVTPEGSEQVTGFYFPGELLGLDGFGDDQHQCQAVALETATVCALTLNDFERLCCDLASLRRQLLSLMGREIHQDHLILMALGQMKGEERLATFLLSLSERFRKRGFSPFEFNLPMPRHDLANYLGLAVETLSRMFSKMQEDGLIHANRRLIKIVDMSQLRAMAHLECRDDR